MLYGIYISEVARNGVKAQCIRVVEAASMEALAIQLPHHLGSEVLVTTVAPARHIMASVPQLQPMPGHRAEG